MLQTEKQIWKDHKKYMQSGKITYEHLPNGNTIIYVRTVLQERILNGYWTMQQVAEYLGIDRSTWGKKYKDTGVEYLPITDRKVVFKIKSVIAYAESITMGG